MRAWFFVYKVVIKSLFFIDISNICWFLVYIPDWSWAPKFQHSNYPRQEIYRVIVHSALSNQMESPSSVDWLLTSWASVIVRLRRHADCRRAQSLQGLIGGGAAPFGHSAQRGEGARRRRRSRESHLCTYFQDGLRQGDKNSIDRAPSQLY